MVKICQETQSPDSHDESIDIKYGFPLSNFQKHAIVAIKTGNHALITAHTGSGKTLPAEYAIEYFTQRGKKVIYTSPIKALSNQKYNEFVQKYPDISFGILTGDIKFNPEADVLIMTTEILRNQLFHNSLSNDGGADIGSSAINFSIDLDNDLGCVIFDEVHYINDKYRGKVWEETILNMPPNVQMIMLSATIDMPEKFAEWIETRNDNKDVHLITTNHRVVPLYHHAYITLHESYTVKIKDVAMKQTFIKCAGKPCNLIKNGKFDEGVIHKMQKINSYVGKMKIHIKRSFVLNSLVGYLYENNLLPAICFIFSRNQVEQAAREISFSLYDTDSKLPMTIEHECRRIIQRLPNYKEYIELPEYRMLISLLQKGIAIHHAGMLPVFREMIELLFAKNYIKLLFATETFAVGINMPTKTVIFPSLKKFDGNQLRLLYPHEYTQMAGRAGRRGIDTEGHVIHCNNLFSDVTSTEYSNLICGKPQKITSKFNLSYNLILNLVANDCNTPKSLASFTEQSLMQSEIKTHLTAITREIELLNSKLQSQEDKIQFMKTPLEICNEYIALTTIQLSNRDRKKANKQSHAIEQEYKHLRGDIEFVNNINQIKRDIHNETVSFNDVNTYIDTQITLTLNVLRDKTFITQLNDYYTITQKGTLTTYIQEIPGHIFMDILNKYDNFINLDAKYIAAILSCFTNISVKDNHNDNDTDHNNIKCCDNINCLNIINDLESALDDYSNIENRMKIDITEQYVFQRHIASEIIQWCDSSCDNDCKEIINVIQNIKGIFLGDFIKAVIKINTIANELIVVAEVVSTSLHHKLVSIKDLTQKYIITTQSLYI